MDTGVHRELLDGGRPALSGNEPGRLSASEHRVVLANSFGVQELEQREPHSPKNTLEAWHKSFAHANGDITVEFELLEPLTDQGSRIELDHAGKLLNQSNQLTAPHPFQTELQSDVRSNASSLDIVFIDSQGPGLNVDLDWEACCDDSEGTESDGGDRHHFWEGSEEMQAGVAHDDMATCGHQENCLGIRFDDGNWSQEALASEELTNTSLHSADMKHKSLSEETGPQKAHAENVDVRDADWWREIPVDLSEWPDTRRYACHEKYEVLERIGEGTFGAVYKARRKEDGLIVALKKCFKRRLIAGAAENLMREVHALEKLDHPNVVIFVFFLLSHSQTKELVWPLRQLV
jgi:hypothetical protein